MDFYFQKCVTVCGCEGLANERQRLKARKSRVKGSRDFLIFWGALFFSCLVGIIELLPEIKKDILLLEIILGFLYFGLVSGMCVSVYSCYRIIKESIILTLNGPNGDVLKQIINEGPSVMEKILLKKDSSIRERVFPISVIIIITFFALLYLIKMGILVY